MNKKLIERLSVLLATFDTAITFGTHVLCFPRRKIVQYFPYKNSIKDFDGKEKTYQVVLNDYVLLNCDIAAGSVFATVDMDFYDTEGNIINSAAMKISVRFLSNKTMLTLTTNGQESASFLEQYFADNGIRLKVIEIL